MAYYLIKSSLSDFVLDVDGGCKEGHKVFPFDRHGKDNQIWYDDLPTGTIRCKQGHLCLTVKNDQLIVEKYQDGNPDQLWIRQGKSIRNGANNNKALDIYEEKKEKGAKIGAWTYHGKKNQCWDFIFVGGEAPVTGHNAGGPRRLFYIISEMNGKVLDVSGGKKDAGAKIVMWDKNIPPSDNQLWYLDETGYIRSALNDMTFNSEKAGDDLRMQVATGDPRNQWTFHGRKIGNRAGECLDIQKESKSKGAELCSYEYKDQENQHWIQEFV